MAKKFIIATAALLVAMEIVKRLYLSSSGIIMAYNILYFIFMYYIAFLIINRFIGNIVIAIVGAGGISGVLLWAMHVPGVGLAIWLSGLFLSLWSDRKAAVLN